MSPQTDLTKNELLQTFQGEKKVVAPKNKLKIAQIALQEMQFPSKKDEKWKNTDIKPILRHKYEKPQKVEVSEEMLQNYLIKDLDQDIIVLVNGFFSEKLSTIQSNQQGFFAGSIQTAKSNFPDLFQKYFGNTGFSDDNIFSALNTAFAEDGFCIIFSENYSDRKPVHIINFTDGSNLKVIIQSRNLIIAQENSQAKIINSYHSLSTNYTLGNTTTEIFVDKNANLDYNLFQGEGDDAFHISNTQVLQKKSSTFTSNIATLCGALVRNSLLVKLEEPHCYTYLNGLYMPDREQHFDNHILIKHDAPHCQSNQNYKGIIDNKAESVFTGKVYVGKKATKTDAAQSNKNLLLSAHSKAHSRPQLEIHTDDVSCSHGSTTGQLDQEALYYIRTRGIGMKQAKELMTYAFASEIINKISIEPFRKYINFLTEMRLKGEKITGICSQQFCYGC